MILKTHTTNETFLFAVFTFLTVHKMSSLSYLDCDQRTCRPGQPLPCAMDAAGIPSLLFPSAES